MSRAIGMVELTSIARGIEVSDLMVKAASVELLRSCTICPGKYIVLIGGDTAGVQTSMKTGIARGGEYVVDTLTLSNASEQLFPALAGTTEVDRHGAVGVAEYYSVASAVFAADVAVKAANVTLVEIRIGFAIGGKGFFTITGEVGAVRAAMDAANEDAQLRVESVVIPRPSEQLYDTLL